MIQSPRFHRSALAAVFLSLAGVTGAHAQALTTVELSGFESGSAEFSGALSLDKTAPHAGASSGRLTGDFTTATESPWVTAELPLDLRNPLQSVSFWVKSTDAHQLTVRIDDSTNQVHQVRPEFAPNGQWQKVTVSSFENGMGHQNYGGAADGVVHWPAKRLVLILEKNGLLDGRSAGTVWVDQLEAQVKGPALPAELTFEETAKANDLRRIADFENGLSGFSGIISASKEAPHAGKGAARMQADLTGPMQEPWITATRDLSEYKAEIKALRFWARSTQATQLTVRLVDATGQNLQLRPKIPNDGRWHAIVIKNFGDQPGREMFGGADDKVVHWPVGSLSFILEKNGLVNGKGAIDLDDVEIVFGRERIVGALDLLQARPGNIFTQGEQVVIPVDTQASSVKWTVRDSAGRTRWQGVAPVVNKSAAIRPAIDRVGYFEMTLEAGGARRETTLAVLTPFDVAKVAKSPFGVMTHFAQGWDTDVMPLIAKAGIKHIRDEIYWDTVERVKGAYEMDAKFERYLQEAKTLRLDPLLALTFGNRNYDSTPGMPSFGNAPFSDEGRAAYSRYSKAVLDHYGEQLQSVEIWNEYNGTFGKGPVEADRAGYYFAMLKDTYATLKQARPDLTVVGVSAVATPFPYFEELFKKGALNYMDALSLHPYRTEGTPEGLERLLGKLNDQIHTYSPDRAVPVWITELGWFVKPPGGGSDLVVTEADQANYLVRAITLTLSAGVERFYWYHARDDPSFPTSGILRGPEDPKGRYTPKPAYVAYATLVRQLDGARFVRREPTVNEDTYCLLFERGDESVRVLWSLAPAKVRVQTENSLALVDLMGASEQKAPKDGAVELSLSDTPVYVVGKVASLPPETKEPGKIIADSEEQFSHEQNGSGWSYGYYVKPAPDAAYDVASWQPLPNYNVTIWGYEWLGRQPFLTLTPSVAHPAVDHGKPVWAVRRWTSDVAGKVRIQGKFGHADQGDGTEGIIFVDGVEVWRRPIGGTHAGRVRYDVVTAVAPGTRIDIALTPGPGADISYDSTSSFTQIRRMP